MAGIVSKDIYRLVKTTTTEIDIMDRIYHGDVDAYNIDIEFYGVTSISGTCNLHFVLPDGTALDKDSSDGVAIDGNNVKYTLPTYLYQQSGNLTMYVQFMNSNIYTPLKVNFKNIVAIPDGGEEVVATTTYPVWYDEAVTNEDERVAAELIRVSNEVSRVTAETARSTWEEFNAVKVYVVGEKVYYPTTGSSYIMHTASGVANTLPTDTDYWQIIVEKGASGIIDEFSSTDMTGVIAGNGTSIITASADDLPYVNTTSGLTATDTQAAIDELADEKEDKTSIGNRTYTENNYVTDGESLTASIDALDVGLESYLTSNNQQISLIEDKISVVEDIYVERELLNGVTDEINGTIKTQNISDELVLNGSEDWYIQTSFVLANGNYRLDLAIPGLKKSSDSNAFLVVDSNLDFQYYGPSINDTPLNSFGISVDTKNPTIRVVFGKSYVDANYTASQAGVEALLADNPITIVYELETTLEYPIKIIYQTSNEIQTKNYFDSELSATKLSLANIYDPSNLNYIFITDLHADSGAVLGQILEQIKVVKYMTDNYPIDFVCVGGDIVSNSTITNMIPIAEELNGIRCPVYVLNGNHDGIDKSSWGFYILNNMASNTFSGLERYFYSDILHKNIRVICLDAADAPDETPANTYWGWSEDQIDWLIETLSDTDQDVLLLTHIPDKVEFSATSSISNTFPLSVNKIIRAFNGHTSDSWTDESISFSCNFTGKTNKIIAENSGHKHISYLAYHADEAMPYIVTPAASPLRVATTGEVDALRTASGFSSWEYGTTRTDETATEAAFDIISVGSGSVNRIRFGAGDNKNITY